MARLLSVEEAAKRLDVVPQRVRALVADGRLPAQRVGWGYVLDSVDIDRFARGPRLPGRPLSSENAWALLAMLAGVARGSLSERPLRSRGRLESLLRRGGSAVAIALSRSEPRAEYFAWRVLPQDVERLFRDPRVVRSGLSADARGINVRYRWQRDGVDGYVSEIVLRELERELQPIHNSQNPNALMRVPLGDQWILREPVAPLAVVAADLLDDDDPRVARGAQAAIRQLAP